MIHVIAPVRKKVLITGCGRSGTKYITFILRRLGLDVMHEKVGRDGTASWLMAVDSTSTPWGPGRSNFEFQAILHQVRNPLAVIPSLVTFKPSSWNYIHKYIPHSEDDSVLVQAAKYWYYWNQEVEKVAHWRYRIEDFQTVFFEFCNKLDVSEDRRILSDVALDVNTRNRGILFHWYEELCERLRVRPISKVSKYLTSNIEKEPNSSEILIWKQLNELDPYLATKVKHKAESYGYDLSCIV